MRLVNARTLELKEFRGCRPPRYAIVSHRWESDEVTFDDIESGNIEKRKGYQKLQGSCWQALQDGCEWVWLDTCCINKSNAVELAEAINSMYNWYKEADICLVYLYDLGGRTGNKYFEDCEWWTRGWTLQELIAPANVVFFDCEWRQIGKKIVLCESIAEITGIDVDVLRGADPWTCSVAQRMSWAAQRKTTEIEDQAYCLLGLFNVSIPMQYGDRDRAFLKLQEEIIRHSYDHTIFAWDRGLTPGLRCGLFAQSAACFEECQDLVQAQRLEGPLYGFSMTQLGLSINLLTIPYAMHTYLAILECCQKNSPSRYYGILVQRQAVAEQYGRIEVEGRSVVSIRLSTLNKIADKRRRLLFVRQLQVEQPQRQHYAFWVRSLKLPGYGREELSWARLFSRDGYISRNDGLGILKIPETLYGTAGMIHLRPDNSEKPWWRIEYLVFGFDDDFIPYCMLGNSELGRRSYPFVQKIANRKGGGEPLPERAFSNSWLRSEPLEPSRADFKRRSYCIVRLPSLFHGEKTIDFLNLTISIRREPVPEGLQCLRSKPWTVWAIDIRHGQGPSPQALATRDTWANGTTSAKRIVTEGLPRWGGRALMASIGADALGGVGEMLAEV